MQRTDLWTNGYSDVSKTAPRKSIIAEISLYIFFVFYPIYVFLNAYNGHFADSVLFFLLLLTLPRLFTTCAFSIKPVCFLVLWSYGLLAIFSLWFPPSSFPDYNWFLKSFYRISIASIIVFSIGIINNREIKILKWVIIIGCFWLSISIILNEYGFVNKTVYQNITFWNIINADNNDKYSSFWLLFSIWSSISFLWKKSKKQITIAILCYIVGGIALFSSTSESAQLGFVLSTIIFACAHIKVRRYRYALYLTIFMIVLLVPIIWISIGSLRPEDTSSLLYDNWAIGVRLYLYDFCAKLIREGSIIGYGFGSTLNIPVPDRAVPGWSEFPGGHPHNIIFLLILEYGIWGGLLCLGSLLLWFDFLYYKTNNCSKGAALWALAISGQVVYSLSFSIWYPDVILSYCLFFCLILIVASQFRPYVKTWLRGKLETFIIMLTVTGILTLVFKS